MKKDRCKKNAGGFQMKRNPIMTGLAVLVLAGAVSACFSFQGGDETVVQQRSPTTDAELRDLKAAYDKGIISEREYNQQRDRLLGR
jgi:uncharacterized membrane protein